MKKKFVMMLLSSMMAIGSMSIVHAAEPDEDFADVTVEAEGVEAEGVEAEGVEADGVEAEGVEAEGVEAVGVEAVGVEAEGVEPRKIDTSGSFSLSVGPGFEKSFKVGNLIGADHDAFKVKVTINSGATTPLVVTITSDNGYYYSKNITSDTTITVKNCDPDEKYTVKFSTNAYDVTEHVSGKYYITSYIE